VKIRVTKNSSRPLAAQFFFRGHLLSKLSVFSEFIEHLPAATEFDVQAVGKPPGLKLEPIFAAETVLK